MPLHISVHSIDKTIECIDLFNTLSYSIDSIQAHRWERSHSSDDSKFDDITFSIHSSMEANELMALRDLPDMRKCLLSITGLFYHGEVTLSSEFDCDTSVIILKIHLDCPNTGSVNSSPLLIIFAFELSN